MTNPELLQFLALLELEDYATIEPEDIVTTLRIVEPLQLDDLFIKRFYALECGNCYKDFRFVGENLLDATCAYCGSAYVHRK